MQVWAVKMRFDTSPTVVDRLSHIPGSTCCQSSDHGCATLLDLGHILQRFGTEQTLHKKGCSHVPLRSFESWTDSQVPFRMVCSAANVQPPCRFRTATYQHVLFAFRHATTRPRRDKMQPTPIELASLPGELPPTTISVPMLYCCLYFVSSELLTYGIRSRILHSVYH
jgi:hypothetical protein